jgi:hypothetical protein
LFSSQTKIILSVNLLKLLYIISHSLYYQFIAYPPHVYDAYAVVLRQLVAQLRYEYMQAAGVEEAVVSPKVEQYILGIDHLIAVFAEALQYFRFAV